MPAGINLEFTLVKQKSTKTRLNCVIIGQQIRRVTMSDIKFYFALRAKGWKPSHAWACVVATSGE